MKKRGGDCKAPLFLCPSGGCNILLSTLLFSQQLLLLTFYSINIMNEFIILIEFILSAAIVLGAPNNLFSSIERHHYSVEAQFVNFSWWGVRG